MNTDTRVPVTVITGFLGSGKTTLLNRILSEKHGARIAVIENEFGEVGVDNQLVIQSDEEIFEMNNGCICCTVRGDLIRILGNLMKRRDKFDHVMIETTGLADPGPVAQTFFVDDDIKAAFRIDGIVTVVDAKHISQHIDDSPEAQEQIAFADLILLNKTDLVAPRELDHLEERIHSINTTAKVTRCQNADVPIPALLDIGGFSLDRALAVDSFFLEPEYPFEWGGLFDLPAGDAVWSFAHAGDCCGHGDCCGDHENDEKEEHGCGCGHGHCSEEHSDGDEEDEGGCCGDEDGHHHHHEHEMFACIVPANSLAEAVDKAARIFSDEIVPVEPGDLLAPGDSLYELDLHDDESDYLIHLEKPARIAIFTQHHPAEFDAFVGVGDKEIAPVECREFKPDHTHDEEVGSVGFKTEGALDEEKLSAWIGDLLKNQGANIFRMKGVLNVSGRDNRIVFQGVHMLFDAKPGAPWAEGERRGNTLIFIGRNLDRAALTASFEACMAR